MGTPGTGRGGKGDKAAGGARMETNKGKAGLGRGASLRKPPHGRTSSSAAQLESLSDQGALATAVAIATGGPRLCWLKVEGSVLRERQESMAAAKVAVMRWSAPAQQQECCCWKVHASQLPALLALSSLLAACSFRYLWTDWSATSLVLGHCAADVRGCCAMRHGQVAWQDTNQMPPCRRPGPWHP